MFHYVHQYMLSKVSLVSQLSSTIFTIFTSCLDWKCSTTLRMVTFTFKILPMATTHLGFTSLTIYSIYSSFQKKHQTDRVVCWSFASIKAKLKKVSLVGFFSPWLMFTLIVFWLGGPAPL